MKTGSHLKIQQMGSEVMGVRLLGNPKKPEPEYFRICLPFGDVDISRCRDGSYWVHTVVYSEAQVQCGQASKVGVFMDGRIDIHNKHASDVNAGDFANPDAYHVAVRIGAK